MNPAQVGMGLLLTIWALSGCASVRALTTRQQGLTPAEHLALGHTYLQENKTVPAAQQYQMALQQDKKFVPALMALGNIAFEKKDFKQARQYYERALDVTPKDPALINNLAMVDLAEGKPMKDTVAKLENLLTDPGPMRPYLLDTLATIALREGRFMDARYLLSQAIDSAPQDNPELTLMLEKSGEKIAAATR
jgi:Tfp pilus assembly protein PilF